MRVTEEDRRFRHLLKAAASDLGASPDELLSIFISCGDMHRADDFIELLRKRTKILSASDDWHVVEVEDCRVVLVQTEGGLISVAADWASLVGLTIVLVGLVRQWWQNRQLLIQARSDGPPGGGDQRTGSAEKTVSPNPQRERLLRALSEYWLGVLSLSIEVSFFHKRRLITKRILVLEEDVDLLKRQIQGLETEIKELRQSIR